MRVPIHGNAEGKELNIAIHTDRPSQQDAPPAYNDVENGQLGLGLHPLPAQDALVVKIQPPRVPALLPASAPIPAAAHVPCDIVLVVDVSGSMATAANVPGEDEATGLSVLDLVKHAAKTILETMDARDRLGIVTFGARSQIVQRLQSMTGDAKSRAQENIDSMRPGGATNLWHGILDGFRLFESAPKSPNVPAIMILTDGLPNHMCPSVGYIPKLRTMLPFPGSIHTFGFGYRLRSGLLKSIAEIGGGNYAFIPDAGMIGTVFVHAVANLQATFATRANLRLRYRAPLELAVATGSSAEQEDPRVADDGEDVVLDVQLGNLQFGQSRDILLRVKNLPSSKDPGASVIHASLMFSRAAPPSEQEPAANASWNLFKTRSGSREAAADQAPSRVAVSLSLHDPSSHGGLSDAEVAYHESRARLCSFLSSIFPHGVDRERRARRFKSDEFATLQQELSALIANMPARVYNDVDTTDKWAAANGALMEDLEGEEPRGQISLAINNDANFLRWGTHYLPSYLNAHTRQVCNSFKDAGPLLYGTDSPLFCACRDRLDAAFDSLPPPMPSLFHEMAPRGGHHFSRVSSSVGGGGFLPGFSMSAFNRSRGPCFAASTPVELASGKTVPIARLRRGTRVRTPAGPRCVALVLRTPVDNQVMCRVGDLLVTPWHPIRRSDDEAAATKPDSASWCFPATLADKPVRYSGAVYSILLQPDRSSDAHAIRVANDTWGVTLGHGIMPSGGNEDVRAHEFLGDWARVARNLTQLGPDAQGVITGGGMRRDERTGRVCGFVGAQGSKSKKNRRMYDRKQRSWAQHRLAGSLTSTLTSK